MKAYLNPHDRFATRLKASLVGSSAQKAEGDDQQKLFVDGGYVDPSAKD